MITEEQIEAAWNALKQHAAVTDDDVGITVYQEDIEFLLLAADEVRRRLNVDATGVVRNGEGQVLGVLTQDAAITDSTPTTSERVRSRSNSPRTS